MPDDLREQIKVGLNGGCDLGKDIFNHMQSEIVRSINETTYPSFLQSDLYFEYIDNAALAQGMAMGTGAAAAAALTSTSSSSSGSCSAVTVPRSSTLPTLHEGTELSIPESFNAAASGAIGSMATAGGSASGGPAASVDNPQIRLTRNLLLATQERRLELRPQGYAN